MSTIKPNSSALCQWVTDLDFHQFKGMLLENGIDRVRVVEQQWLEFTSDRQAWAAQNRNTIENFFFYFRAYSSSLG